MTLGLTTAMKVARSTALINKIDVASVAGKLKCYSGSRPATGGTPSGVLLVTITLAFPCGTADAAGSHLTTPITGQCVDSGLITWARLTDGDGNALIDGDVRMLTDSDAGSADFIIDDSNVFTGGFVTLVSSQIAEGG